MTKKNSIRALRRTQAIIQPEREETMEKYIEKTLKQMGHSANPLMCNMLKKCLNMAPEVVISLHPDHFTDQEQVFMGGDEELHFLAILLCLSNIFTPGHSTGGERCFEWLRQYPVIKWGKGMKILQEMHEWKMKHH